MMSYELAPFNCQSTSLINNDGGNTHGEMNVVFEPRRRENKLPKFNDFMFKNC